MKHTLARDYVPQITMLWSISRFVQRVDLHPWSFTSVALLPVPLLEKVRRRAAPRPRGCNGRSEWLSKTPPVPTPSLASTTICRCDFARNRRRKNGTTTASAHPMPDSVHSSHQHYWTTGAEMHGVPAARASGLAPACNLLTGVRDDATTDKECPRTHAVS